MAKIIGLCGSPRKGATEYALEVALEAAEKVPGIETELILLRGKDIKRCIHCNMCMESKTPLPDYCTLKDDMKGLIDRFVTGDGFIIGSPVYEVTVTGLLKDFMDRFRGKAFAMLRKGQNPFERNPRVGGGIAVGGTRHGGQELTLTAINNFYLTYEFLVTGGPLGNYLGASVWSKDRKAQGVQEDEVGLDRLEKLGKRVAEFALVLEAGRQRLQENKTPITFL
jgi:multimeric flavodoxin WrbA